MIINEEKNYIREFWVKLPTAGLNWINSVNNAYFWLQI